MSGSQKMSAVAMAVAVVACLFAGAAWWKTWSRAEPSRPAAHATPSSNPEWLQGTTEERFAQVERHLRGLDQAMAEIGYRYGELLFASHERNWDYAKYQADKIELTLRLSLERRPKRAQSSQAFLSEALPAVMQAVQNQEPQRLDQALERLHNSCVECHRAEKVLYFRTTVDRIRENAKR